MSRTPWNSIAESVPTGPRRTELTMAEAKSSPCATCSTSPCCTHLPLTTFKVTNLVELDHAAYLLNFDHIELGVSTSGEWGAYYALPCRFLDRETFDCTVHATPQQPQICVHYNPYSCWYKRALTARDSDEFVRIDRHRLALLTEHIAFDEDRRIVAVPQWDDLVAMMGAFDDQPAPQQPEPSLSDPMIDAWQASVEDPTAVDDPTLALGVDDFADPCTGCDAYCCTTLVFPHNVPTHVSNFDYYRFALGFPGVEVVIGEGNWSIALKTTCRHLQDGRCGVYGQPERPLICTYYDAARCEYKPNFGVARPGNVMRLRLEQYGALVEGMSFSPEGALLEMPSLEQMRATVEASWPQPRRLPLVVP